MEKIAKTRMTSIIVSILMPAREVLGTRRIQYRQTAAITPVEGLRKAESVTYVWIPNIRMLNTKKSESTTEDVKHTGTKERTKTAGVELVEN